MSFFQSLILGVVQGVTEFLPISSTAHLILVPWLFRWDDFAGDESLEKAFDEHDFSLAQLAVAPLFKDLRTDARFQALVRKVGIPQ